MLWRALQAVLQTFLSFFQHYRRLETRHFPRPTGNRKFLNQETRYSRCLSNHSHMAKFVFVRLIQTEHKRLNAQQQNTKSDYVRCTQIILLHLAWYERPQKRVLSSLASRSVMAKRIVLPFSIRQSVATCTSILDNNYLAEVSIYCKILFCLKLSNKIFTLKHPKRCQIGGSGSPCFHGDQAGQMIWNGNYNLASYFFTVYILVLVQKCIYYKCWLQIIHKV